MKHFVIRTSAALMLLVTASSAMLISCSKKEEISTIQQSVQQGQSSDYVHEDQLEEMLLKACELADPNAEYVAVKQVPDKPDMYDITILSLEHNPLPNVQSRGHICEGSLSMSLVKCMKIYIIANVCGIVRYSNGNWTLDACPS